ncbi:DUF418 domain-containing protein [Larkinella terrae]|uniref:DUF418 domain-containing protein n=1 Tax=Larkinella terrae TaxID=2025311 RepID=A0A7K0EDR2_9BACT|nr:DUF418 domain-containing protein [Larkinella terrae]MRS59977.1 DUF418 domain-containing protein [Larkinella terrae]
METPASTATAETPRPVDRADRIRSIDVIRGVALLGILMMNIPYFGLPEGILGSLKFDHPGDANYLTHQVIEILFSGKMRALFSMLFGAGVILLTTRKEHSAGLSIADIYYRRILWMVLFGVIDAYVLLWTGDILYAYGLCGLFLFPFRKLAPRYLLLASLVCFGMLIFKGHLRFQDMRGKREAYLKVVALEKQKKKLTDKQKDDKKAWETVVKNGKPDQKKINDEIKNVRSGYPTVWAYYLPINTKIQSSVMYEVYFWDVIGMMFLGMALYKLGVFTGRLRRRGYLAMLLIGYGIGIPLGWWVHQETTLAHGDFGRYLDSHFLPPNRMTYDIRRVTMALGHVGLIMIIYKSGWLRWLTGALAAVGQMAFSNYVMQTLICTFIFFGYGLGNFGRLTYYQLFYVVAGVWAFQLVFSSLWLRFFYFGPLEWAWRSLTYWKRQPFRISQPDSETVVSSIQA